MDIKVGKKAIEEASKKLSNWGRWGKEDQIGTLNHVTPENIVDAAKLIRTGKVFALGIPLDRDGPQTGLFGGRFNPIHQMLATGTDAIAGQQDWNKIRYADDTLMLCVQGATHWDALGHIFHEDKAYNGHDAKLIDSRGLSVLGIEHSKNKMVGRGVLLDIARFRKVPWMKDGESISNDELNKCARAQNVEIRKGDFVIVRTGQMERCLSEKEWGDYAGGDAPGDEVGRGLSAAAGIGHVRELDAGEHLEQFAGEVWRAADADRTEQQLVGLGLRQRDQLRHGGHAERRMDHQNARHIRHQRDRR